jgi:hypothetical protein
MHMVAAVLELEEEKHDSKRNPASVCVSTQSSPWCRAGRARSERSRRKNRAGEYKRRMYAQGCDHRSS